VNASLDTSHFILHTLHCTLVTPHTPHITHHTSHLSHITLSHSHTPHTSTPRNTSHFTLSEDDVAGEETRVRAAPRDTLNPAYLHLTLHTWTRGSHPHSGRAPRDTLNPGVNPPPQQLTLYHFTLETGRFTWDASTLETGRFTENPHIHTRGHTYQLRTGVGRECNQSKPHGRAPGLSVSPCQHTASRGARGTASTQLSVEPAGER